MSRVRKTFMRRSAFTLFEILIAVALLVVLSGVLLRVFVLIGDYWTTSDEQARLYADAKTALAILSEDLGNVLYSPPTDASTDKDAVAPMILEAFQYTTSDNLPAFNTLSPYNSGQYCPWLHLVTRTMWGEDTHGHSHEAKSDVRKVSYLFVPPSKTGADRTLKDLKFINSDDPDYAKVVFSGAGELARICRSDYQNGCSIALDWGWHAGTFRVLPTAAGDNAEGKTYFPMDKDIIKECKRTVATGVLDFRVYAYRNGATRPISLVFPDSSGTKIPTSDDTDGTSIKYGMTGVKRIQIVLTLMPPARLAELRKLTTDADRKDYIYKHARTFRKTIRIKEMEE